MLTFNKMNSPESAVSLSQTHSPRPEQMVPDLSKQSVLSTGQSQLGIKFKMSFETRARRESSNAVSSRAT